MIEKIKKVKYETKIKTNNYFIKMKKQSKEK